MGKAINIFISYAHEDVEYLDNLTKYLKPYEKQGLIKVWTDKEIDAGQRWHEAIIHKLKASEIILFLVSQDFLVSDYINDTEIKYALENSTLILIPIIIRPISMSQLMLKSFQIIPTGAKAIEKWPNKDEAWVDVIEALKNVFDKINRGADSPAPVADTQPTTNRHQDTLARVHSTDTILLKLILVLMIVSIVVFVIGLVTLSTFYLFAAFTCLGMSLLGYVFIRKNLFL